MPELRLVIQGSPEQTQVFVGKQKVSHVQKVTVSPTEIQIYFPAPDMHLSKRAQIERSMMLVRGIPGVVVGHIVTDDTRTLGKTSEKVRGKKVRTIMSRAG